MMKTLSDINISIVNHFHSFMIENCWNTGKMFAILSRTVVSARCSNLSVTTVLILLKKSNNQLITSCSLVFFSVISATSLRSNFWIRTTVMRERMLMISAAGRQINKSDTKDPKAKMTVLVYIKFMPANSFRAFDALVILSMVFPEWLSVCRSIGREATWWNKSVVHASATWNFIFSSRTRETPWKHRWKKVILVKSISNRSMVFRQDFPSSWMMLMIFQNT